MAAALYGGHPGGGLSPKSRNECKKHFFFLIIFFYPLHPGLKIRMKLPDPCLPGEGDTALHSSDTGTRGDR